MSEAVESAPAAVPGGGLEVDDEVVEKLAVQAARAVPGVADLGGDIARFFDSLAGRIGLGDVGDAGRGVEAKVTGTNAVINVVLVIEAGHVVQTVTEEVRARVAEAVEKVGVTVTAVNVKVDDIELTGGTAAAPA